MSETPVISILHPTARVKPYPSFPQGWRGACNQFFATAKNHRQIEYVLIVHESRWEEFRMQPWASAPSCDEYECALVINDPGMTSLLSAMFPHWGSIKLVRNTGRDCVVDQINAGAAACTGKLLLGIMDDLVAPEAWDEYLLHGLGHRSYMKQDSGEWVNGLDSAYAIDLTGEDTKWMVYGAITRGLYEQQGYVLHPAFESMYADNYASHCYERDGVLITARYLGFRHNHPVHGTAQHDEVYALQNRQAAYVKGQATFNKLVNGTRTLAVCFPGEQFNFAVQANQKALIARLPSEQNLSVFDYMGHCTNVYAARIELTQAVNEAPVDYDFVYWQDDDNFITPEQFAMLLADLDAHPGLDGVVGWCWCDNDNDGESDASGKMKPFVMSCGRQSEDMNCARFTLEDIEYARQSGNWLITSGDIAPDYFWSGFPCVLLRGETQRKLGWEAFKPLLMPQVKYGFTSEDTSFFYNATRAGMKFAVDLRVKVPHIKLRAIEPQYLPEAERPAVERAKGKVRDMTARDFMNAMEKRESECEQSLMTCSD